MLVRKSVPSVPLASVVLVNLLTVPVFVLVCVFVCVFVLLFRS